MHGGIVTFAGAPEPDYSAIAEGHMRRRQSSDMKCERQPLLIHCRLRLTTTQREG